jgi:hypothetical protein
MLNGPRMKEIYVTLSPIVRISRQYAADTIQPFTREEPLVDHTALSLQTGETVRPLCTVIDLRVALTIKFRSQTIAPVTFWNTTLRGKMTQKRSGARKRPSSTEFADLLLSPCIYSDKETVPSILSSPCPSSYHLKQQYFRTPKNKDKIPARQVLSISMVMFDNL